MSLIILSRIWSSTSHQLYSGSVFSHKYAFLLSGSSALRKFHQEKPTGGFAFLLLPSFLSFLLCQIDIHYCLFFNPLPKTREVYSTLFFSLFFLLHHCLLHLHLTHHPIVLCVFLFCFLFSILFLLVFLSMWFFISSASLFVLLLPICFHSSFQLTFLLILLSYRTKLLQVKKYSSSLFFLLCFFLLLLHFSFFVVVLFFFQFLFFFLFFFFLLLLLCCASSLLLLLLLILLLFSDEASMRCATNNFKESTADC